MPLPIINIFNAPAEVDAAEAASAAHEVVVLEGPCFVTVIDVGNYTTPNTGWSAIIHRRGFTYLNAIYLFQREFQRGIGYLIIWEGRRYIPQSWVLEIHTTDSLTLGDQLHIHGGYESVV